jgi:hypothetical protein
VGKNLGGKKETVGSNVAPTVSFLRIDYFFFFFLAGAFFLVAIILQSSLTRLNASTVLPSNSGVRLEKL